MKNNKQLLNNIIGQLNGVSRMMEEGKECREVVTQLKAVKSAIGSLMGRYIEENALICLDKKTALHEKDKEKIKKLFKELVNN